MSMQQHDTICITKGKVTTTFASDPSSCTKVSFFPKVISGIMYL